MKIALFFPPHWTPTMPHLALPALTAYLRAQGIQVSQRDLNAEFFDHLLSPASLQDSLARARQRHRRLGRTRRSGLTEAEYAMLGDVIAGGDDLVDDVTLAKGVLRSSAFYEPDENLGAMLTVMDALKLVSAPHFPDDFNWYGYQSLHSPDASQQILAAVADSAHGLFASFYHESVLPELVANRPDIVGISLTSVHQVIAGLILAGMVKRALPQIHVTVGGKMISCWRDVLPRNKALFSLFDSAVYFEGEQALLALANTLESHASLDRVPNLVYRDGENLRLNPPAKPLPPDSLPPADFGGLALDKYLAPELVLPIEACRGCYWRQCAFCNLGYGQSRAFGARSAERVAAEMATQQQRLGARNFFFVDEALSPRLMGSLAQEIPAQKVRAYWAACTRFEERLDRTLLEQIASAGCRVLMFGLESGSQRVLDRLHKGTDLATISRVLRDGAAAGLWNHVFCFFGFPGETRAEADETISFVEQHLGEIHSIASGTFVMEKQAEVCENPEVYDVTRIIHESEADLAFQYAYEVRSGQSVAQAQDSLRHFTERIGALRQPQVFFYDVYNLLYAAHVPDRDRLVATTNGSLAPGDEA